MKRWVKWGLLALYALTICATAVFLLWLSICVEFEEEWDILRVLCEVLVCLNCALLTATLIDGISRLR